MKKGNQTRSFKQKLLGLFAPKRAKEKITVPTLKRTKDLTPGASPWARRRYRRRVIRRHDMKYNGGMGNKVARLVKGRREQGKPELFPVP
jgi:hypothetical protein